MLLKRILYITALLFSGMIICVLIIYINLSGIIENKLKQGMPDYMKQAGADFIIKKTGLTNTCITDVSIAQSVYIESINLSYGLRGFSTLSLDTLTIGGLTLSARLDKNNKIIIDDFDFKRPESNKPSMPKNLPSFFPEKIVLRQARLFLKVQDREYLIPFDALSVFDRAKEGIKARAKIYPFGEKIDAFIDYSASRGLDQVVIEGKSFNLIHLSSLFSETAPGICGITDFKISSESPSDKWSIFFSKVGISSPEKIEIKNISSELNIENEKIHFAGEFDLLHGLVSGIGFNYVAELGLGEELKFDLKLRNFPVKGLKISHPVIGDAKCGRADIQVEFSGTPEKADGDIALLLESLELDRKGTFFKARAVRLDKKINIVFNKFKNDIVSKVNVFCKKASLVNEKIKIDLPSVSISGPLNMDEKQHLDGNLIIKTSNGNLVLADSGIKASRIVFKVPYNLSGRAMSSDSGQYSIGSIILPKSSNNAALALSINGRIKQNSRTSFELEGRAGVNAIPELKLKYTSSLDLNEQVRASLKFNILPVKMNSAHIESISGQLIPHMDIYMTALAAGEVTLNRGSLTSTMNVSIQDGNIQISDSKISLSGLAANIEMADFFNMRSRPGQILSIDAIEMDKVRINDTKMRFSLENMNSFLVENLRFRWCDGLVSTESIRFPQKNEKYHITLYCDRLNMVQLLNQLGNFDSKGAGTLSGRIPVVYSKGDLSFDDGFLFTTPGNSGIVAIDNIGQYTAGIPMDSPQMSQIDLAQEALKEFNYKWAKIYLKSSGDNLSLRLNVDGKPSKILPFRFKKDLGRFVRVDASSPGSQFEGINLDLNLNLPFNEVVKFGNKLESIFNK